MPPNYDFHNCLSPREFEELVRDILEIKEKVPFEISGRGKDGGADLRYWEGTTKIIVQVKCYQNNFRQLLNVLKNQEKQKAKTLKTTRYILVTSIKLEITERDEIFNLFDDLIRTQDDIIDRDDLNKLLGIEQYQNVERTHYKLWLSSTGVLMSLIEEIVHRDILSESRGELKEIKKTVKVFVQNPIFGRAVEGVYNGKTERYKGSTAQDLLKRMGKHKWNNLITAKSTTVTAYEVTAELNIAESRRGTQRSALNEALLAAEQQALDENGGKDKTLNERDAAAKRTKNTGPQGMMLKLT